MTTIPGTLSTPSIRDRAARAARAPSPLESLGRRIVLAALARLSSAGVRLIDSSGATLHEPSASARPIATVRVSDPSFYSAVAFAGGVGAGEAYMNGAWHADDLPLLIEALAADHGALGALDGPIARCLSPLARLAYLLDRNTRRGARRNIVAHYDLGNEFFSLFLDPTMTYSSAIFERGAATLEEAQIEKIDRACRLLALRPSDHLLEIGTGWGALAMHAATKYGCRVTTTTISDEQHRFATERIRRAGLADRITVIQTDYRDLSGQYDKLVSIEMIEAVGAERLGDYFQACSRLLTPSGAALIQSIVIRDQLAESATRRQDFLKKYIFPGSCLPSVASIMSHVARSTDLSASHLEDIGPHYATTLRMWRDGFLSRLGDVRAMGFDERFIRMWEYYLAYCEGTFRARRASAVQLLLTKPMWQGRREPSIASEPPCR